MRATMKVGSQMKTYDTDLGREVCRASHGEFGDPAGWEEILYQMPNRAYFLLRRGGDASPYAEPTILPATSMARITLAG